MKIYSNTFERHNYLFDSFNRQIVVVLHVSPQVFLIVFKLRSIVLYCTNTHTGSHTQSGAPKEARSR